MSTRDPARFARHLADRIGAAGVPPADLLARAQAAFGDGGFAALLAPDSADGVAAVLAACSEEGWPVMPIGAGTWLRPAHAPSAVTRPVTQAVTRPVTQAVTRPVTQAVTQATTRAVTDGLPPVLLSTIRLDRITEHEPADLVIGVQAGLTIERLAAALAAEQQWLPLDPAAEPNATIGAIVARADAGPLRAGHGTPRDMALGIEIATGDGRLLRFGGRVVKNVAGYDGVRLAVGSRGRLGVITALYLRVRGAPHSDRTVALDCGHGPEGIARGAALALAVRDAVSCDALDLVSPAVTDHITSRPGAGWTVLVRLLGGEAAVTDGLERIRRVTGDPAAAAELPATTWDGLRSLEAGAEQHRRLTGSVTGLADDLAAAVAGGGEGADRWMCAAHAADGVIRLWSADEAAPAGPSWRAGEAPWRPSEEGPAREGAGPRAAAPGQSETVRELTRRLRAVFDPAGIMHGGAEV